MRKDIIIITPKDFIEFGRENRLTILLGGLLVVFPFILPYPGLATEILIYALAAVAFDLCLGYTGVILLCQASFFGTGVYATGLTLIHLSPNIFLATLIGILGSTGLAVMIGFMATRRAHAYMALLTLAFNEMIYFIAYEWKSITGGDDGLRGIVRPNLEIPGILSINLQPSIHYYYFVFFVFLLSFIVIRRITISPLGKILQGIRENEIRAQSIGYDTRLFKIIVFAIGGMFMGLAGSLYCMFVAFAHIHNVDFNTSIMILLMTVVGGMGTLIGPVIGAFFMVVVSDTASAYWERWPVILGVICILIVLFARGGIWSMLQALLIRARKNQR